MKSSFPTIPASVQPWITTGVFGLITLIAIYLVTDLRSQMQERVAREVEDTLSEAVADWEERLLGALRESVTTLDDAPEAAARRQQRLRQRWPWFSSLYVWRPPGRGRRAEPTLLFPTRPVIEQSSRLMRHECIAEANAFRDDAGIPASDRARILLRSCDGADLPVRLYAASEAAQLFEEEGNWDDALAALEEVDPGAELPLVRAAEEGVPPYRLAANRSHVADLLVKSGEAEGGLDLYYRLGLEITSLDAPAAAAPLQLVEHAALPVLRRGIGRREQVSRLDSALQQARRRVAAYREVVEKLLPAETEAPQSAAPRFVRDQYSADPYLLYVGSSESGIGVALQLEGRALVSEFLKSRGLQRLERYAVVRDSSGRWVEGSRRGGRVVLEVPLGQSFPEYRLGVRAAALDELEAERAGQWTIPLTVTIFMAALGVLALLAQLKASRQSEVLLQRQRDFTTRVTHELKTPLAGIRVMAENIEVGAFRDERQLQLMARRIVDESDRLTERVEEVLAVARERQIPDPTPFDPEEAALAAIDQWGPRLEAAGVGFAADLHPTDEVLGDLDALRDALSCLLDNALKYRREDSSAHVWLKLFQEGRFVELSVTDNGLGVPTDMRRSIFERFVRVEGDNRGRSGGHGLGLSQVAEIARAHRGRVVCEEGIEGGSRFVLRLPAR